MSGEKGGACSPPIPMLHSLRVSSVPWGKTRRYHNTYEPRLADTKSKSAYSPAQCPRSFQSWLLGPSARKCHFSLRHLTPYHSFQIPHLFFTLKSAPGTTFKKKKKKKSHLSSSSSNPTLESNIMFLGDTGLMPTPQVPSEFSKCV